MFSKVLIPVLAVIGTAAAATSTTSAICAQKTATINSAADATALADCTTITGDVVIGTDASGVISLDGPDTIEGSLIIENNGAITSFSSSSIATIGNSFTLNNLTLLSTLQFSTLTSCQAINWAALPALPSLTFTKDVKEAGSVIITNTFLSTLDGINLDTVDTLNINNNNRLKTFSTQVGNVTTLLNIDSNGKNLDCSFPNLIWAANMTFRNVSSVSIPSLAVVNGSLGFYENYFTGLSAPNLTSVGNTANGQGGLAFVANPSLANITMPLLSTVGGAFQIANNSGLDAINFQSLADVGGAIDFSGNFTTPELPKLNDVKGGFNMQSTTSIDCSGFKAEHDSGNIQGTYTCKTTANAQSGTGSSTSSGTSSSSSSTASKGAAVSYGVNEALMGVSVVGGFLSMLL
ncbi:cell wall protein Ecm33 [Ciborinia camelliae]|nr:cell wall protein Ecm33 [Ciborinia camelliae]